MTAASGRVGGLRRKREKAIAGRLRRGWARRCGVGRRLSEIAVLDTLGLDNSLARSKVPIGVAGAAARLLETERQEAWAREADLVGSWSAVCAG
jgi:hypothetical protein